MVCLVPEEAALTEILTAIGGLKPPPAQASGLPMLKQAVVLLWGIGRARGDGERLMPWTATCEALVPLLEAHRREGERDQGRPDYPVAALYRAGLWDLQGHQGAVPPAHGDTALKGWFDEHRPSSGLPVPLHDLVHGSGEARIRVVDAIVDRFFEDWDYSALMAAVGLDDEDLADDEPGTDTTAGDPKAAYRRWCDLVVQREDQTYGKRRRTVRRDPIRLAAARRAVLLRSEGRCENPACDREAPDLTDQGDPILEVDHIAEITAGGRDFPEQMIALCPDCHAVKTRGRSRHQLRPSLLAVARQRHLTWISEADGDGSP
ncbi:HNH endonuclease [Actinomadura scrupuli]|uniref:HNH endonuclease n=1 Tax=Actinomadura scrupuli TaxID=559629 RepID=UPI003D95BDE1